MYRIRAIDKQDASFSCAEDKSVLDMALQSGIKIPYACRGGGCGMCKVKVVAGTFELGLCSKAVLPPEERTVHYVLACKTYPRSDLEILISQPSIDAEQ